MTGTYQYNLDDKMGKLRRYLYRLLRKLGLFGSDVQGLTGIPVAFYLPTWPSQDVHSARFEPWSLLGDTLLLLEMVPMINLIT